MPLQSSVRALKKPLRLDDEVRFLRSWIEKPLSHGRRDAVGAGIGPHHGAICRHQVFRARWSSLGPGTGAITNALIEHGVDQKRLVLVEYNPGFCALLRDRYPHAKVVQGDAYSCATRCGMC